MFFSSFDLTKPVTLAKLLILVALLCGSKFAFAATLSLTPGTGVYSTGQTFTARVVVNTGSDKINAAEGTLSFKPSELQVVGVAKGSIFNLWTAEPSFSNSAGTVSFSGGTPTGYQGSSGTVLTITFRAATAGSPRVNFSNGSVLAADGRGTNVLTGMSGGSYTISAQTTTPEPETIIEYVPPANTPAAPQIASDTHPDPDQWYQETTAKLSWSLPSGVTAMRTLLDSAANSIPTKVYDTPQSALTLSDLEQGVQYFHLQFKNADGWGRVAHYRLAVDSEKPTSFSIALPEGADLSNPIQTLELHASDTTSVVERYKVQLDGGDPFEYIDEEESGIVTLPSLVPGYHTVIIEAFDQAGNSLVDTFSFTILAFDKPIFTDVPATVNAGVIPVFKGQTRPQSTVEVTLSKLGAEPVTTSVTSDESGVFTFIPSGALSEGVYDVSAVAVDQYGAQSARSETVRVAVQQAGYLRVGSLLVSALSVFVPLMVLLLFLIVGVVYVVRRLRAVRTGVTRETREALDRLQSEFAKLEETLRTHAAELAGTRKTKKLTKAEAALIDSLTTGLKESRASVAKEIADVTDIVD